MCIYVCVYMCEYIGICVCIHGVFTLERKGIENIMNRKYDYQLYRNKKDYQGIL